MSEGSHQPKRVAPAAAFAVLPKLTQLKSLSLGSYPMTVSAHHNHS